MQLRKDTADLQSEPALHIFIYTEMRRYIQNLTAHLAGRYISLSAFVPLFNCCQLYTAALLLLLLRPWRNNQKRSMDSKFPALSGVKCKDCFFYSQRALSRESATGRRAVDQSHNFKKAVQVQMKMVIWALLQIQSRCIYYHVRLYLMFRNLYNYKQWSKHELKFN